MGKRAEELRKKAISETKKKISARLVRRDNLIVQAVKTIDLIDKVDNLLLEQLKDWYALYFPELARNVEEPEEYLTLLINLKMRENFTTEKIVELVGEKRYRLDVPHAAANTMGGSFKESDVGQIASFASEVQALRNHRKKVETYLEQLMMEEAPNISAVVGHTIGARLIARAGSLEKFAEFPSSTVQVLGAEKALFAHLRKHAAPPKHGLIFAYPKLRGAPQKLRGKIARKLAAKLAIAAKVDFFKGQFVGDRLAAELEAELAKLGGKK